VTTTVRDLGLGPRRPLIEAALGDRATLGDAGSVAVCAPPDLPLDEALDAVEALAARAAAHDGPVLLVSDLGVFAGRAGTLFELPIAERPFPRARRGESLDLEAELALARRRAAAAIRETEHADRVSARRARARADLEAAREPSAALDDRLATLHAEARAEALEETRAALSARLGLDAPGAYVALLCEHALPGAHVVRLASTAPDLLGEAARRGLLSVDDDVTVDLLPTGLAEDALGAVIAALLDGAKVPKAIHLSTADRSPLGGARLKDLLDLYRGKDGRLRRSAEDLRGRAPAESFLTWPDGARVRARNIEKLGVKLEVEWREALLREWLPRAEDIVEREAAPTPDVPLSAFPHLGALLDDTCDRHAGRVAFSYLDGEGQIDVTYRELRARARAACSRLAAWGVEPGDRVLLAGKNHPTWPIAAFGVVLRGAVLMPVDKELEPEQLEVIQRKGRPALALLDKDASARFQGALECQEGALELFTTGGPHDEKDLAALDKDDLASVLFTSGTTGEPKGVMLAHHNFTSLLAGLSRIFEMADRERLLSVLPLHHTFEFSCGLLLPLVAGGHIYYLDELAGERVLFALARSRATAMVGVPALWQLLGRRVETQIKDRGPVVEKAFGALLKINRTVTERLGKDVGRVLFAPVHKELGGQLKTLISGGAALPADVHALFRGLGLPLAEGYGLTEAAPVLTVADQETTESGTVGRPIPGVEVKIEDPDDSGAGEVLARGGNVMRGYFEDEAATAAALTEDGWLRTGDLGRVGEDGALRLVGRAKDVVVTASGENIYLDDAETLLARHLASEAELTLVGVADPRGGERLGLVYASGDADDIQAACKKLPPFSRPSLVRPFDEDELPRTATRKVKRKVVAAWLTEAVAKEAASSGPQTGVISTEVARVRKAVAQVTGLSEKELDGGTRLLEDLGFDSLMWVELAGALEAHFGRPDPEALASQRTLADVAALVRRGPKATGPAEDGRERLKPRLRAPEAKPRKIPSLLRGPLRGVISRAQKDLYQRAFPATVEGQANIPQNRSCIVVANHCSHLDTGLVKYALGPYGKRLRPLAAKDYFFEGNPWKVAFFEELTNLAPIDRESGSGLAFEQARDLVQRGEVVLIFPEGTRRADGTLGDFKPLVGRLALATGAPVLPMHLEGTFEALPRGASLPRPRELVARIGRPLDTADLESEGTAVAQARAATAKIRAAVEALDPSAGLSPSTTASSGETAGRSPA
jgi:long-chain acyl-CoA synthetase